MRRLGGVLIIALGCLALIVHPVSAEFNGYTVEPATPGTDRGTPLEVVEVGFWDLPPQIIILYLAASFSPVLSFPLELVLYTKIYLYFGYRKVAEHNMFNNAIRKKIYTCICENPGITYQALQNKTEIQTGTLQDHLALMRILGKISPLETCGHTRYFDNSGKYTRVEQKVVRFLQMPTERIIFEVILKNPEVCRKEIQQQLGISGASVTWHMSRLSDAGLITVNKVGKSSRYVIHPEVAGYVKKYLEPYPETSLQMVPEPV